MYNSQSPAHSVAYSGMLQLFATDGYELTSRQVQAGFKKLGLDFKEILKPTTDWVTEERIEEKEESKEIKTEEFEDFDIMNSYSKFRIIECRLSLGRKDFELTRIGTKNRIR